MEHMKIANVFECLIKTRRLALGTQDFKVLLRHGPILALSVSKEALIDGIQEFFKP